MFNLNFNSFILFEYFFDTFRLLILNILIILILIFSCLIIIVKNPIHAVFSLIITFILVSLIMIGFLNCEFLPIIFLIVYVGAVSILFLFIVMLLNIKIIDITDKLFNYFPIGAFIGFLFFFEVYIFIYNGMAIETSKLDLHFNFINYIELIDDVSEIETIAIVLYEHLYIEFILASLLLLIAMIGAILLTVRNFLRVKRQIISEQVYRDVYLKFYSNK